MWKTKLDVTKTLLEVGDKATIKVYNFLIKM